MAEAAEIGTVPGNGQPFGNIYNTATPNTEAAGQELAGLQGRILAQQQRYQAVQKNAKLKEAADQQNKIDAQVRGADVPAVHSAYNDWRAASMDLQQNSKNLPRDEYLDRQSQVNQKYADVTKLINDSTQRKAVEGEMLKQQADPSNAYKFNSDAPNYLSQSIKTPIDKLNSFSPTDENGKPIVDAATGKSKVVDLTDPTNYAYKPIMDFTPTINDAVGKGTKLNGGIPVGDQNGINRVTKDYTGVNNPFDIASTLSGTLGADDAKTKTKAVDKQQDFLRQYGNVSPQDMAATDKQFQQQYLTNPDVKAAYGLKGTEQFPNTGNPQVDNTVKYLAQKQALLHPPTAETKTTTNEAVKDATDHKFDLYKAKYEQGLRKGDDLSAGKSIDDNYALLTKGNGQVAQSQVTGSDGKTIVENRPIISAPLAFRKQFAAQSITTDLNGKKATTDVIPDALAQRPDGSIVGIYNQKYAGGNTIKVNGQAPQRTDITPVQLDQKTAKLAFAKATGGDKAVESLSKYQQQSPTYTVGGKKYSNADLKKMGYNDDQINQAIKLGTIKQ